MAAGTYGMLTDNERGVRSSTGELQREFVNRPVWMVTFSGPAVQIEPSGPVATTVVHHEVTAVIDAATGKYLMGFSYQ